MDANFPLVAKTLTRATAAAIQKILEFIQQEVPTPLARTVAARRWKNGYGLPKRLERYGAEIYAIGEIYRAILNEEGAPKRTDAGVSLSLEEEAGIVSAMEKAALWVYARWAPSTMAKIVVRGGGFEKVDEFITEYRMMRNIHLKQRMEYRSLLRIMFNK